MPDMRPVFSSFVSAIGYDEGASELHVAHQAKDGISLGKTAIYQDVPKDVAEKVFSSASIGEALHAHVRGKYQHRYQ